MFKLLEQDDYSLYDYLSDEEKKVIKRKIIKGILSTDMAQHFSLIEKFQSIDFKEPKEEDRDEFFGTIIHAMDIGNPLLKFSNYYEQATLVSQEFHDQTIMEKIHGLEVTSFFIFKDVDGFLQSQVGFINTFVIPLFQIISDNYEVDYC